MLDELTRRIDKTKELLAAKQRLEKRLADGQETLNKAIYQLDTLDIQLGIVASELEKLEGLNLMSLLAGLTGSRAARRDQRLEEFRLLQQEYDACEKAIAEWKEELPKIETELGRLGDLEGEFKSLCEEKMRMMSEGEDENARHLQEMTASLSIAQEQVNQLEKAIEEGRSLASSVADTQRSSQRIRRGSSGLVRGAGIVTGGVLIGAAVSTAYQSWSNKRAAGLTSHIFIDVRRLRDMLLKLDLSEETGIDAKIRAALGQMELFSEPSRGRLGGDAASWLELEGIVRGITGDLEEKLAAVKPVADDLQQQVKSMVENS